MPKGIYLRVKRQFCTNGHDLSVVGRNKDGKCKICKKAYSEKDNEKRTENPKEPISEKLCERCNILKPSSEFAIDKRGYVYSYCKLCKNIITEEWKVANSEKRKEITRRNYVEHQDDRLAYAKNYRKNKIYTVYDRYIELRGTSKHRHISFDLTFNQYTNIIKNPCYYCGIEVIIKKGSGIDRVDNNIGYTISNSVSCCTWCNRMKSDKSQKEFFEKIKKIGENVRIYDGGI